jgi:hypothetical protein
VDQAVGDFGRIWRAVYVQSNSVEDIVVTRVNELLPGTQVVLRRQVFRQWVMRLTWAIGLLVAVAIWVSAWRNVMSRRLGFSYSHWFDPQLWIQAGSSMGLYAISNAVTLLPILVIVYDWNWSDLACSLSLITVWLLPLTSLGLVSGFFFVRNINRKEGIPKSRAAQAYISVVVMSCIGFGLFYVVYLILVGVL